MTSAVPVKLSQLPEVLALVHSIPLMVLAACPPLPHPPLCHRWMSIPLVKVLLDSNKTRVCAPYPPGDAPGVAILIESV
jgi:hypothetical protein